MQVQKVSVAKAPDGSVYANVVPGDVVDVQTFKKRKSFWESSAFSWIIRASCRASMPAFWGMWCTQMAEHELHNNFIINKMKF
jgi:tRNA/tmRNA/rRNA uracil-C5-methylase (TrmA/RlmC/RlmD family)